ncbi:right-handed parallel beta-helix repeat-containing protein [Marinobacteraceae bacterium S3BR75-40.1]
MRNHRLVSTAGATVILALLLLGVWGTVHAESFGDALHQRFNDKFDFDKRHTIVVRPGQSIQAAIDRAQPGTRIYVLAGTYKESGNATNGLNISKSGISLVGQRTRNKGVVLENAGNQRNGIVAVPPERTECMACHTDLAPPFPLYPEVDTAMTHPDPVIKGLEIRNITIKGFDNNGLFTELVDDFKFINVHSVNNPNYGIFPTRSSNGLISHSSAVGANDSGIWIETSTNVRASHNLVAGNVNGFEISNSDDIEILYNEARGNTVGIAALLLPDIYPIRGSAKRLTIKGNYIHDNNRENTAHEESILGTVPKGIGILHVGIDDSDITGNLLHGNGFSGIVLADYCVVVNDTPYACGADPDTLAPGFIEDSPALNNRVTDNLLINNGTVASPHPFDLARADLTLITDVTGATNCYDDNLFTTFFSTLGFLPGCE